MIIVNIKRPAYKSEAFYLILIATSTLQSLLIQKYYLMLGPFSLNKPQHQKQDAKPRIVPEHFRILSMFLHVNRKQTKQTITYYR